MEASEQESGLGASYTELAAEGEVEVERIGDEGSESAPAAAQSEEHEHKAAAHKKAS